MVFDALFCADLNYDTACVGVAYVRSASITPVRARRTPAVRGSITSQDASQRPVIVHNLVLASHRRHHYYAVRHHRLIYFITARRRFVTARRRCDARLVK